MIGEDVYYSQSGEIVGGNGGWDKSGLAKRETRKRLQKLLYYQEG